jgi:hypothetical protein
MKLKKRASGILLSVGLLFLGVLPRLEGHPVSFKDSISLMSWNTPESSDHWLTYSWTHRFAHTLRYMEKRVTDDMPLKEQYYFLQNNFLLKRWNAEASQANIYLGAAYGMASNKNHNRGVPLLYAEADWESRRYYIMGEGLVYQGPDKTYYDEYKLRVGFAPYLTDFDKLHSWLILQSDYMPESSRNVVITPLIRQYIHNLLWEIGYSSKGDFRLNFMVHI